MPIGAKIEPKRQGEWTDSADIRLIHAGSAPRRATANILGPQVSLTAMLPRASLGVQARSLAQENRRCSEEITRRFFSLIERFIHILNSYDPLNSIATTIMRPPKRSADFLVAYCIFALLACLPIILFVPRYIDDYGRGVKGYFKWAESGFRPLADLLYHLVNLGSPATALAPLGQLLSILIAAIGALAISRAFQVKNPFMAVLATLPLVINPYFLENLSYGFDCLSMTAALTLAILAASQVRQVLFWRHWIGMTACLLASLLLYQPAFGAYLPIALTAWLWQRPERKNRHVNRDSEIFSLSAVVGAPLASLFIYRISAELFWIKRTGYGESSSGLKSPLQLLSGIGESVSIYLRSLWSHWHSTTMMPIFLLLTIGFIVALSIKLCEDPMTYQGCAIAVILPAVLICLAPGPMYLLSSITFIEIPRMNIYLGGLFCSFTLPLASFASALSRQRIVRITSVAILFLWVWCQIVFSYAYGHAMQAQREFEQGRLTRLIYDISHLDASRQASLIQFEGAMPASPLLANTARKFPFMNILVPRMINGHWAWGAKQLTWHGLSIQSAHKNPAKPEDVLSAQGCRNNQTSRCSSEHNIVLAGEHLIVKMKP